MSTFELYCGLKIYLFAKFYQIVEAINIARMWIENPSISNGIECSGFVECGIIDGVEPNKTNPKLA